MPIVRYETYLKKKQELWDQQTANKNLKYELKAIMKCLKMSNDELERVKDINYNLALYRKTSKLSIQLFDIVKCEQPQKVDFTKVKDVFEDFDVVWEEPKKDHSKTLIKIVLILIAIFYLYVLQRLY